MDFRYDINKRKNSVVTIFNYYIIRGIKRIMSVKRNEALAHCVL